MTKLEEYFHTNWQAMTFHDWLGLGITIVVFCAMLAIYAYVFHPANKDKLESQRFIPLDEDTYPGE